MAITLKIIKAMTRYLMYVGYAAVVVLLAITVWDVIARYAFGKPSSGITEISQMLLIITMITMAHAIVDNRWIQVGVVVDKFPLKVNIAFEVGMAIVAVVIFFIIGSQLIIMAELSVRIRETYFVLGTPRWPMYAVLGISFLACILATFVYTVERIKKVLPPKTADAQVVAVEEEVK